MLDIKPAPALTMIEAGIVFDTGIVLTLKSELKHDKSLY